MNNERIDELASLRAIGLIDQPDETELLSAMDRVPAIERLVRDYAETAASLAFEAPQVPPPPDLKKEILRQLPPARNGLKAVPRSVWIPYAIAACLMCTVLIQFIRINALKSEIDSQDTEITHMNEALAMIQLHLKSLEAKDPAPTYQSSRIAIAWDPLQHHGVISMQNLPDPPDGHNYQLWVLDPGAETPISAGIVHPDKPNAPFTVKSLTTTNPGFALTLEPGNGSPEPTGSILFAVAPGQ